MGLRFRFSVCRVPPVKNDDRRPSDHISTQSMKRLVQQTRNRSSGPLYPTRPTLVRLSTDLSQKGDLIARQVARAYATTPVKDPRRMESRLEIAH